MCNINEREYLLMSEYAKLVGKSKTSVHRYVLSGKIPAYRLGNRYFIHKATPYPSDPRIVHGAYIGVRRKIKNANIE